MVSCKSRARSWIICAGRPPFSSCRTPQTKGEIAGGRGYLSVAADVPTAAVAQAQLAPLPMPVLLPMGFAGLPDTLDATQLPMPDCSAAALQSAADGVGSAEEPAALTALSTGSGCAHEASAAFAPADRVDSSGSTAAALVSDALLQPQNPACSDTLAAAAGLEHAQPGLCSLHLPQQSSSLAMLELEPVADGDWQVCMQPEPDVNLLCLLQGAVTVACWWRALTRIILLCRS